MTEPKLPNRRTVLQGIAATSIGGGVVTGRVRGSNSESNSEASDQPNEIEIVADHDHDTNEHLFEFSTHEVTSGWTTITLSNQTDHTHFSYLAKIPQDAISGANDEGTDLLDYYIEHVTRPFQWFADDIHPEREPDPDDLSDKYTNIEEEVIFPPWFENVLPSGGAGLTSGHMTSIATVDLDPGEYVVECYVKDAEGKFHSYRGMINLLSVTDDRTGSKPEATLDLSLSTTGLDVPARVQPGQQTVAIQIEDQQLYEHLLGHDVHLIRFDESTTVADLNGWMNWMNPNGLVSGGSEPGTFLGGVQTILTPNLLEGNATETAYFDVDLNPGAYAWVSEVPAPNEKGMVKPFIVPFE